LLLVFACILSIICIIASTDVDIPWVAWVTATSVSKSVHKFCLATCAECGGHLCSALERLLLAPIPVIVIAMRTAKTIIVICS
jgi:hypothetical protein